MGATDWSLIGGNPAPGDVTSLDGAAGAASTVRGEAANHLAQIQGLLSGWTGSGWSGAAADRFEELLQGVGQHLSQMEAAHDPIGRALARHAATLLQQQLAADQALQRAVSAAAQEASASARRTAASEEHAQHAETYSQAASDLSRIGDAINQRLQQLASAGIQLLGDLTHIADSALQALLGEKQVAEAAQAAAQEGMRIASGIIGEMDALIADATADLRGAIRLADEVRSEVESSVQTAERAFGDVDNDLRDIWCHVQQDVVGDGGGVIDGLGIGLVGLARLLSPTQLRQPAPASGPSPGAPTQAPAGPEPVGTPAGPAVPTPSSATDGAQAATMAASFARDDYEKVFGRSPTTTWCGLFAAKVLKDAGLSVPLNGGAEVSSWIQSADERSSGIQFVTSGSPERGDLVVYFNERDSGVYAPGWCHIGVVTTVSGNNIQAAQGNFNGSQENSIATSSVELDSHAGTLLATPHPDLPTVPSNALVYEKESDGTTLYAVVLRSSPT